MLLLKPCLMILYYDIIQTNFSEFKLYICSHCLYSHLLISRFSHAPYWFGWLLHHLPAAIHWESIVSLSCCLCVPFWPTLFVKCVHYRKRYPSQLLGARSGREITLCNPNPVGFPINAFNETPSLPTNILYWINSFLFLTFHPTRNIVQAERLNRKLHRIRPLSESSVSKWCCAHRRRRCWRTYKMQRHSRRREDRRTLRVTSKCVQCTRVLRLKTDGSVWVKSEMR